MTAMPSNKPPSSNEWDLPKLRASINFQDDWKDPVSGESIAHEFFDVKFYPYNPPGAPPIFAITSKKHVIICRITQNADSSTNPVEVLKLIRDDDENAANCSCCWSKDLETGQPWLCIAGADAKVKVYDVKEGKLVKTLVGHGGGINDLVTSPLVPSLIASCSDDTTVRLWSLLPIHSAQPCMFILGGDAHIWDLLSISFHDTGRYLLSAGHDQTINLWTIPPCPKDHVTHPQVIHYPHFSTKEIHNSLVDCVSFFGDLILSRACWEETIVLWSISGFSSSSPSAPSSSPHPSPSPSLLLPDDDDNENPPTTTLPLETAPTTFDPSKLTRSAFWQAPDLSPATRPSYFTRLVQFKTVDCKGQFYLRFKVLHARGKHPVLAFCNAKNKFMFWDLSRLGSWNRFKQQVKEADKEDLCPVQQPGWMPARKAPRKTAATDTATATAAATATATAAPATGRASGRLGTGTSTSPDPETLLSAAAAAASAGGSAAGSGSGRPGSSSRERPGSRGSTATNTKATATAATATAAAAAAADTANRPTGIRLGGYTQKQIDEWNDQCDITDSHNEIKPHKTVMVDGKGQHFVGRQVAWSPEGDWCVVVGNSNRAMIFQRWGK
ncbi:WD40-repeat-containing domain protein [Pseudoneurospora amorphoporcata]|uniref:WD40-repeat-containing domain protein n=1 Tax=Pseudoneurospora amorphoporcata TaxID=241081 RepID=A0AAN6P612_9PEZI|nr:WD40-repeat-containing domain protein [Pseudoneurospora amorphoporcata]